MFDYYSHGSEAVARIIHVLDAAGKVVEIGWEPACTVIDRDKAISQVVHLLNKLTLFNGHLHDHRREAAIGAAIASSEYQEMLDALRDLRALMPILATCNRKGLSFPRSGELVAQPQRQRRRGA